MYPVEEILKRLMSMFMRNPKGWKIMVNVEETGFANIYILSPGGLWQIRVESLHIPKPLGLGVKVGSREEALKRIGGKPFYGFRPLDIKTLRKIIESIHEKKPIDSIIRNVLNKPVISLSLPIKHSALLEGPVIYLKEPLYISRRQKRLEEKLNKSLKNIMRKEGRYMGYV